MERIRKLDGSTSYSLFCDKVMASTHVLDPVIMCANSIDRNLFFLYDLSMEIQTHGHWDSTEHASHCAPASPK